MNELRLTPGRRHKPEQALAMKWLAHLHEVPLPSSGCRFCGDRDNRYQMNVPPGSVRPVADPEAWPTPFETVRVCGACWQASLIQTGLAHSLAHKRLAEAAN